ncbi:hypothetical protein F4820DRAFT_459475 [Hypoxylon rubiginosum]|uniref:Uncharacterized protein n=1 Tax=Hypoxylon rubiginosum TaxID=110542 RepID=A0ACB9YW80_9PEZI|nr:hypothetical protein F4820DRAFT_459475 [Hypoxylon rubiginosum]
MNRTRPARSKTGCSSCRRRKVRCDEAKPLCQACKRLGLCCSYEPGRVVNSAETLRYRVRFVNSRYTELQSGTKRSESEASSPQQQAAAEIERNTEGPKDTSEAPNPPSIQQCETSSESSAMPHSSPVQASVGTSAGASAKAVPEPYEFSPNSHMNVYAAPIDNGYVPAFFDLNMNFDLLNGEDSWSPQTPGNASVSESAACQNEFSAANTQDATVVIGPEDHRLIQHYLNVMTNYAKIRCSGDDNIYSHIFSNMALFYAPLYNAIMAWTALHLGQTRSEPELVRKAEERYLHAISLTYRDQNVALHFELSIVTIWFALQFELLSAQGIESFCRHLEFAADLVDAHRLHQRAGGEATPLGHIGCRMLVWLGAYDARASCIGGQSRLLSSLSSFCSEYDFIDTAFPSVPSKGKTEDLKPCLRLSLELDLLESRIVQLHRRSGTVPVAIWSTVQSGLEAISGRLESDPSVAPIIAFITKPTRSLTSRITTRRFNCLLLLASFYSVVITFHRMLPAPAAMNMPSKLTSAEDAATYIIRLASWVCRFRPPSPQNLWPRLLFLAGIETTDITAQDWVIKTLSEAEVWGANFRKTRLLLERVIKIQSTEGVRVDYLDVMRETGDMFII